MVLFTGWSSHTSQLIFIYLLAISVSNVDCLVLYFAKFGLHLLFKKNLGNKIVKKIFGSSLLLCRHIFVKNWKMKFEFFRHLDFHRMWHCREGWTPQASSRFTPFFPFFFLEAMHRVLIPWLSLAHSFHLPAEDLCTPTPAELRSPGTSGRGQTLRGGACSHCSVDSLLHAPGRRVSQAKVHSWHRDPSWRSQIIYNFFN